MRSDQPDLFDDEGSKRARDDALDQVTAGESDWLGRARLHVILLPIGWEGTGEDIRLHLLIEKQMEPPHHHNVWGAFINGCVRSGWLELTGYRHMKSVRSHARRTPLYRRV